MAKCTSLFREMAYIPIYIDSDIVKRGSVKIRKLEH